MDYLNSPIKIQFELSSMCNALCLGCVRTDTSTFNSKKFSIPDKQYIGMDAFDKILTSDAMQSVTELEFCGTIDDPLMHPQFIEFIEHAASVGADRYRIQIHTNASLRNAAYWTKLANALAKFKVPAVVKFSIDGLEDTNHIYRQNTTWSKIMENATAFISAGGNASWQYLIFPWNEHQLMQAKELSVQMGFKEFMSRHDRSHATKLGLDKINHIKVADIKKTNLHSTTLLRLNEQLKGTVNDQISCNNKNKGMYFVSFDSKLWPCCFLNNGFFANDPGKVSILEDRLFNAYNDSDWNDLTKHSVEEILSHSFYTNDLVASWDSNIHGPGTTDRIHRCTEVCSVKNLEKLPVGGAKVL